MKLGLLPLGDAPQLNVGQGEESYCDANYGRLVAPQVPRCAVLHSQVVHVALASSADAETTDQYLQGTDLISIYTYM